MEYDEVPGPDGLRIRVPTNDGYRTCSECGGDCYPDPGADAAGLGVRIAFVCPTHGVHSVIDPFLISHLFNTSASNIGNAAMQAANIPSEAPIDMRLGAHGPGEEHAYIEIPRLMASPDRSPLIGRGCLSAATRMLTTRTTTSAS